MAQDVTRAREHLIAALEADLIGPYEKPGGLDVSDELLKLPPSRWYLTGFLAPMEAREVAEPTDDELAAGPDHDDEDASSADAGPKRKHFLPASIGMSVLLPPAETADTIRATVRWADYRAEEQEDENAAGEPVKRRFWRRAPHPPVEVDLALDAAKLAHGTELPDDPGIWLMGRLVAADAQGLTPGTRALSLFVVNRRGPGEKGKADERFLFQPRPYLLSPPRRPSAPQT